jgi:hypothetical protein
MPHVAMAYGKTGSMKTLQAFDRVRRLSVTLPGVETVTRYDGSPGLKARGVFMAGMASHPSAEPGSLVVRTDLETRELLLEDAPETYYVTGYYAPYPVVLVRLSHIDRAALRDLLAASWRLAMKKTGKSKGRNEVRPYE